MTKLSQEPEKEEKQIFLLRICISIAFLLGLTCIGIVFIPLAENPYKIIEEAFQVLRNGEAGINIKKIIFAFNIWFWRSLLIAIAGILYGLIAICSAFLVKKGLVFLRGEGLTRREKVGIYACLFLGVLVIFAIGIFGYENFIMMKKFEQELWEKGSVIFPLALYPPFGLLEFLLSFAGASFFCASLEYLGLYRARKRGYSSRDWLIYGTLLSGWRKIKAKKKM